MTQLRLEEHNDHWEVVIHDAKVIRCIIDHAFSLEIQFGDHKLVLGIESQFTLSNRTYSYQIDPDDVETVAPSLHLLKQPVTKLTIQKTGEIEVELDSYHIHVKAHEYFEAWQLRSDNGLLIICMPGGELAIWKPEN